MTALGWVPVHAATQQPVFPCQQGLQVEFPDSGAAPKIDTWSAQELSAWAPPACSGWSKTKSDFLIVLTGAFRANETVDAIANRLGAISHLPDIRYWSVTDKDWRPLVKAASALAGPDKRDRRPDFHSDDMKQGVTHFAVEDDAHSGDILDKITIVDRSSKHIAIALENLTPIRLLVVSLIPAHGLQSFEYVEEAAPGLWHVYIATRLAGKALAKDHQASYINRSVALFRDLAGIPTNQEPPARR